MSWIFRVIELGKQDEKLRELSKKIPGSNPALFPPEGVTVVVMKQQAYNAYCEECKECSTRGVLISKGSSVVFLCEKCAKQMAQKEEERR